jgi:hypothetical protein
VLFEFENGDRAASKGRKFMTLGEDCQDQKGELSKSQYQPSAAESRGPIESSQPLDSGF